MVLYSLASYAVAFVICAVVALNYYNTKIKPMTDIDLSQFTAKQTTVVANYNEAGKLVTQARISSGGESTWVDFSDMPLHLKQAAVAIEDERFYSHKGVDWKRTVKGVLNLASGDVGGGSTITQQLVKNLTGNDEYSIKRKIIEIVSALNLEKNNSKDEILEFYLNTIYLANGCRGIEAAANRYFGKSTSELTLAESATIVGITQYPSYYNPITNPENNKERRSVILWKMWQLGIISEEQYRSAAEEELSFIKEVRGVTTQTVYSYFTDYVFECVVNDLVEQKGYTIEMAKNYVINGGMTIITTMDSAVQAAVDEVFSNEVNYPLENLQAAITVIDPYSGKILAIYGGRGEKTDSLTLNRATSVYRQPGSVIKPISVYAPAIEYGIITEATVYDDTPFDIEEKWPNNYDSSYSGYSGLMSVYKSVANSANTVAVKVLDQLGLEKSYTYLTEKFGISKAVRAYESGSKTLTDVAYSPLALGALTVGTNTLELAAAYSAFAASGVYSNPYAYYQVLDRFGNVVLENSSEQIQAISAQSAYIMTDMLMGVVEEGTGRSADFGATEIAGKTGTTSDNKDRWFVGYTPYYSAAVWCGYDIPQEIKLNSTNPALVLWKKVMSKIHENKEAAKFKVPENIVSCRYCADCGKLPSEHCKNDPRGNRIKWGLFVKGTEPRQTCDVHILAQVCKDSGCIAGVNCPLESIEYKALLNLKREFPYEISIRDAQYTYIPLPYGYVLPKEGLVYAELLENGKYIGTSNTASPMNHMCAVHKEETENEESFWDKFWDEFWGEE